MSTEVKVEVKSVDVKSDVKTTVLGAIAGASFWTTINFERLIQGDLIEIARFVGGLALAILGFYTNRFRVSRVHDLTNDR